MRCKEVNRVNLFMLKSVILDVSLGLYVYILTNSAIDLKRLVSKN